MKENKFILLFFCLALILRLGYIYIFIGFNAEEIRDGTFFDNVAVNISEGKGISLQNGMPTAKKPPAYLLFLGGLYSIFGRNLAIARIAQCFIGALLPVFIFFITKKFYSAPSEKIASFLTAIDPTLIIFCSRILVEPMLALSIAIFIFIILKIEFLNQNKYFFISGILLAISLFTRPLLIFLPCFVLIWIFIKWNKESKKYIFKAYTIFLLGFLIIYLPWVIRNYIVFNDFVPIANETGIALWLSNHPQGKGYVKARALSPRFIPTKNLNNNKYELPSTRNFILDNPSGGMSEKEVDDKFASLFFKWLTENPIEFIKLIPQKIIAFWDGLYLYAIFDPMMVPNKLLIIIPFILVMPFAIYGIIESFNKWKDFFIIYLIFISTHILIILTHADYRIRSVLMPYFFIFASGGIIKIYKKYFSINT